MKALVPISLLCCLSIVNFNFMILSSSGVCGGGSPEKTHLPGLYLVTRTKVMKYNYLPSYCWSHLPDGFSRNISQDWVC